VPEKPDIRDVARRAGVSVGTVSNVLNRPDLVAATTRARVEGALADLHYVRNESARQLRRGQSRTVGLIVPDIANPFFTDVARGIEEVTRAADALVIVCNSDNEASNDLRYLRMLAEHQVLGVLHVPAGASASSTSRARERATRVVLLDHKSRTTGQCSVSVNDVHGGELATTHLLKAGHRRIGFVGAGTSRARQVIDRLAGARRAMVAAGRNPDDLVVLDAPLLNVPGGVAAARDLLRLGVRKRPTAVACVNDLLAIGMLQELLRGGVQVPGDVAIVGYDDIAFAAVSAVPLTSVRQPRIDLGRRAATLLLDEAFNPHHEHRRDEFEPELIVRESSG